MEGRGAVSSRGGEVNWNHLSGSAQGIEAAGLDLRRIAVLYFDDLSRNGELGYLADGLTEAVIDNLAQVRTLDVISKNGVARWPAR